MIDGAAKPGNLFHYATTQETILVSGGKKNSLNLIPEGLISMSHLEFFFKVWNCPQAPQEYLSILKFGIFHGQTKKTVHFHVRQVLGTAPNLLNSLLYGK